MTISELKRGQVAIILDIPDKVLRAQAIRFGISAGSRIVCREKLPAGPVIISRGYSEYAIGRRLAETIRVTPVE